MVANDFAPFELSNANSTSGTNWLSGSSRGGPPVNRLVKYSVENSTAKPQCRMSTLLVSLGASWPLTGAKARFFETLPVGCSRTKAAVTPNGLNHETLSGKSPKPLPKNSPGLIVSGALALTPCAPECPIPQARPAESKVSWGLSRYTSHLSPTLVTSKPERLLTPQFRAIQLLSMTTPTVGVRRRVEDQLIRLSVTLPPPSGCVELEKSGTIASSATAGSSKVRVPGKYRLPAIPCASAVCDNGAATKATMSVHHRASARPARNFASTLRAAKPGDAEAMAA